MHLDTTRFGWLALALALTLSLACAGDSGPSEEEQREAAIQQVEMLEAKKEALDEKRARLNELRTMEPAEAAEAEDGGEAAEEGEADEALAEEEIEAEITRLEREISTETQELYTEVVEAFNENPPNQGEPLTEVQQRIVRLKSDEDILVAQEYIEKGGNYQKAIQIYEDALKLDPDYQRLQDVLAQAQGQRYMDEERFSQVEKGMTGEEVAAVLGTPFHFNVRESDDGQTVWMYPKSEKRDAAGVWFRKNGEDLTVIATDFNAVKGQTEEDVEG